jgi:hypothetical protein
MAIEDESDDEDAISAVAIVREIVVGLISVSLP